MKIFLLKLIKLYQKTLSLDHGPLCYLRPQGQCKFHPTCSEYAYQAIEKYGVTVGIIKAIKRLCRCHPWSLGGHDPINQ